MATSKKIGDICIPVGSYEDKGKTKFRNRKLGELWETIGDDGNKRQWGKFNSEIFQTSLLVLNRGVAAKKGDDQTMFSVFEEREEKPASSEAAAAPDDIPY